MIHATGVSIIGFQPDASDPRAVPRPANRCSGISPYCRPGSRGGYSSFVQAARTAYKGRPPESRTALLIRTRRSEHKPLTAERDSIALSAPSQEMPPWRQCLPPHSGFLFSSPPRPSSRKTIGTPFSLHVDTSRNCAGTVLAPLLCFRCGNSSGAEEAGDVDGRRISFVPPGSPSRAFHGPRYHSCGTKSGALGPLARARSSAPPIR
jgi:hypothetical protein